MKLVQPSIQQVVAIASVAMLVSLPNLANAQQRVVPAQSEIAFISKQFGVPVGGKFKKFDAEVTFDPKKVEAAKVNFNVDLLSADIGNSETETELKKPGWFNSLKTPQANFTSTVVVPVTLTQSAGVTRAVGSFTLKRLDFKIGDGEWNDVSLVANEVVVNVKLAFTGIAPL
jgi:polyisoprenoid-binding protein YceI